MNDHSCWELDYELTVKEIDKGADYGVLELAGMSGLAIDKVEYLLNSNLLPSKDGRVKGGDFLKWVEKSGLPTR